MIQMGKCSDLMLEPPRVMFPTTDLLVTSTFSASPKVTDSEGAAAVLELLTSVQGVHVLLAVYVQKHAGHSGRHDSRSPEKQVCMGRGQAQDT